MTEKRFYYFGDGENINSGVIDEDTELTLEETVGIMNELNEENQFLKEKEEDMLDYLEKEYDYVYKQKIKHFDDAILVNCYELIEYHIKSMIEHLERL